MPDYKVIWEIDAFNFNTPEEAARWALAIQRDPYSMATVFTVKEDRGWDGGDRDSGVHSWLVHDVDLNATEEQSGVARLGGLTPRANADDQET